MRPCPYAALLSMTVDSGNPIAKLREIAIPPTLTAAAGVVSDKYSIESAVSRGAALAKANAGQPREKMDAQK